jgi:DNA ligase D-like protein (predicted 3'-phosphoesterase)
MSLEEYQKKRDFDISTEPKGIVEDVIGNIIENKHDSMFVIQEHHATRLHWDLRLEIGGVLRSWAVPKDPIDVNCGTRRLAIQVEDHPVEYANFEGKIPEGMYGAGTVSIYDRGKFVLEEEKENKLSFQLTGNKMHGKYVLIKVGNLGKNAWLLLKKNE